MAQPIEIERLPNKYLADAMIMGARFLAGKGGGVVFPHIVAAARNSVSSLTTELIRRWSLNATAIENDLDLGPIIAALAATENYSDIGLVVDALKDMELRPAPDFGAPEEPGGP